jgi:hypothetical protein
MNKKPIKVFFLILFFAGNPYLEAYSEKFQDAHFKLSKIDEKENLTVENLSSQIKKLSSNQEESILLVFLWITESISYDYESFFRSVYPDSSPEVVLKTRKAVCEGYSLLFKELAKRLEIEAVIVQGYSKGYGYQVGNALSAKPDHSWNAVKLGNKWFLLDVTWGAGYLDGNIFTRKLQEFYFLTPPAQFIYDHYPVDENWQLLETPISLKIYRDLPFVRPAFFQSGLSLESHKNGSIKAGKNLIITLNGSSDTYMLAKLIKGEDSFKQNTFIQRKNGKYLIRVKFSEAGHYTLRIFSKKKYNLQKTYPWAIDYQIYSPGGDSSVFPVSFSHLEYDVFLNKPMEGRLKISQEVMFDLIVPDAESVAVKSGDTWKLLDKKDFNFSGKIHINKGKTVIFAKFFNQSNYTGLLEYEGY